MNSETSTLKLNDIIPPDFLPKLLADVNAQAAEMLRPLFVQIGQMLWHYAFPIVIGTVVLLLIALVKAAFGHREMLGSLLYHIFYFSIFGAILWVRGPELLFSDYFELIGVILNPLCYWLSGLFLERFRNPHRPAFL